MGVKYNAEQNNAVYTEYLKFRDKWSTSSWLPLWCELLEIIFKIYKKTKLPIVELGCGTGQFVEMLRAFNIVDKNNYKGFDFSSVAIDIARSKTDFQFFVRDVENMIDDIYFKGKNIVILSEVLEHLDDFAALAHVKTGSIVIASVPDFDSADHIRHFDNIDQVIERYLPYIDFKICYKFMTYYIFMGVKKARLEDLMKKPIHYKLNIKKVHKKTVFAALPVHGRLELLPHTISRLINKNKVDYVVCMGETEEEMRVCTKAGADWIYYPNGMLGAKWNAGIAHAMSKYNFDAFLFVGTSDWVSDNWIPEMLPYLNKYAIIGSLNCTLLDISENNNFRLMDWGGYQEGSGSYLISCGGGRLYSGDIIRKLDCKLFPDLDNSMDWFSMLNVEKAGGVNHSIPTNNIQILALSTDKWYNKHRRMIDDPNESYSKIYQGSEIHTYLKKWFPDAFKLFK